MADAVVVGSGPNGLTAAIALARAGVSVQVLERAERIGGGMRTEELTLPGFQHDVCSAIHPLAVASPFLRQLPLAEHGVEWIEPPAALAHPFDDGTAALLERSPTATGATLGQDARAWSRHVGPLARDAEPLLEDLLGPPRLPRHPFALARFGLQAGLPASSFARTAFRGERARGFFAGMAAHSMLPLSQPATAGYGLVLALLGHAVGWPLVRGGSQQLAEALASYVRALGGTIETGRQVDTLAELDGASVVLLDTGPRELLRLAGPRLGGLYRRSLERFRYGPGVFKLDWALDAPIPWRATECTRAATVHLGGTLEQIAASERAPSHGATAAVPFVLLAQQSLFDPTRAPEGRHTAWAYCHVPNGSTADLTDRIERQVERFAPGFRERILARSALGPAWFEQHNPNYVGGDINGGAGDVLQLFARPVARISPYTTPLPGVFLCSSSTPPGGGVHGMCGYHAAEAALRHLART
jgi:phytoene dehydrogenase-like protein